MSGSLLAVRDAAVDFHIAEGLWRRPSVLRAVDGVSFDLDRGETLGVVGESGCGKSTLARAILGLVPLARGSVALEGRAVAYGERNQWWRREIQVIFQDPLASLNPRMTVGQIVAEPLETLMPELSLPEMRRRVSGIMERVGLSAGHVNRYPHEFSGGQCQRIGIARALVSRPRIVLCDEPVSALDVSIQAQIVNLLTDLQQEMGLALVFIAHDLAVVRHISHRVMVMYLGRVAELADADDLYRHPKHPYTRALMAAVPVPDPGYRPQGEQILSGDVPSPLAPPSGCSFRTRCPIATDRCRTDRPDLRAAGDALVACHYAENPPKAGHESSRDG
ncbi:MAG: peptide ABC transporter ATP-binding protein [Gammaproteobacteria bacterium SG8_31]|nr:MAG: peptide ABC transporter ATP-binding protein [Gammaproteobacteria bacterium SG8_31]